MEGINELLTRGVEQIYPSRESLEAALKTGKKFTVYQGFDPTGDKLHLGHMVGLMKLADWQRLGHHVIFLIGDGTGQAGDPSGKTTARHTFLSREELRQNAKNYVMQAGKIVKFDGNNPAEIRYNGDWLTKLTFNEILDLIGHFSLQQLLERDLFRERLKKQEPVNLREFIYPLLQGYDSVAMNVDLEIGGTDQTFNMLIGRQLVKAYQGREKFVMTTPLLTDSHGQKIGKTEGNVIALTDPPSELYAKIMTFPDDVIITCFICLTRVSVFDIERMAQEIADGWNPMGYKKRLAHTIVSILNDKKAADEAQLTFEQTVQHKQLPAEIAEVQLDTHEEEYVDENLLVSLNLAASKSEAKRLFQQGAVEINGQRVTDTAHPLRVTNGMILKVGKRKIIRLIKKS